MGVWRDMVDAHGHRFSQWRRTTLSEDLPGPERDGILGGRCVCCNEPVIEWEARNRYDVVATRMLAHCGRMPLMHDRGFHRSWAAEIEGFGPAPDQKTMPPARASFAYEPD